MERPNWERFDSLRSALDLGKVAVARVIGWASSLPERIDTRYADQINEDD